MHFIWWNVGLIWIQISRTMLELSMPSTASKCCLHMCGVPWMRGWYNWPSLSPCFCRYESNENIVITCSTKVCSFGKQVVEKVETEYSRLESSRFIYRIQRSPMCEYMINFIQKLKHLPERYMMNSVLENFTILQVRGHQLANFHSYTNWHFNFFSLFSLFLLRYRLCRIKKRRRPYYA